MSSAPRPRQLALIAECGTTWEGAVFTDRGRQVGIVYGSPEFIGGLLAKPFAQLASSPDDFVVAVPPPAPRLLMQPREPGDTNVATLDQMAGTTPLAWHLNPGQLRARIQNEQRRRWTSGRVANLNGGRQATAGAATLTSVISKCSLRAILRRIARRPQGSATT